MAATLANRVKGPIRTANTSFQDALGARMTHQKQRQGAQQLRLPHTINQLGKRHPLSQSNTYDPVPRYNSLSATNPYNHKSQSQQRPTYHTNTDFSIKVVDRLIPQYTEQ